jgi:hypothetical protein
VPGLWLDSIIRRLFIQRFSRPFPQAVEKSLQSPATP